MLKTRHPTESQIISYCDGTLPEEDVSDIDFHVFNCQQCGLLMASLVREAVNKSKTAAKSPPDAS